LSTSTIPITIASCQCPIASEMSIAPISTYISAPANWWSRMRAGCGRSGARSRLAP
jgi:hypothetical protein